MPRNLVPMKSITKLTEEYKTVGQFIHGHRLLLGISQQEIATSCGVQHATIASIEKDRSDPSFTLLAKILAYLKKKGAPEFNLYALRKKAIRQYDTERDHDETPFKEDLDPSPSLHQE